MYLQGSKASMTALDRRALRGVSPTRRLTRTKWSSPPTTSSTPMRRLSSPSSTMREKNCRALLDAALPLPAYEQTLKASHVFNLLDARKAIAGHRAAAIHPSRPRTRARRRRSLVREREAQGFPLLNTRRQSASLEGKGDCSLMTRHDFSLKSASRNAAEKPRRATPSRFAAPLSRDSIPRGFRTAPRSPTSPPRRLAVLVPKLLDRQPEQRLERRGPTVSAAFDARASQRALQGPSPNLRRRRRRTQTNHDAKGEFLFCKLTRPAFTPRTPCQVSCMAALDQLPIARRMPGARARRSSSAPSWSSCYRRLCGSGEILGLKTGRMTRGHRFHADEKADCTALSTALSAALERRGHVIADFETRRERFARCRRRGRSRGRNRRHRSAGSTK